jgi:hypothetical protein
VLEFVAFFYEFVRDDPAMVHAPHWKSKRGGMFARVMETGDRVRFLFTAREVDSMGYVDKPTFAGLNCAIAPGVSVPGRTRRTRRLQVQSM